MQQSWSDKMVERVCNVIKRDSKKVKRERPDPVENESEPKRKKKAADHLLRRYPVNNTASVTNENLESIQQHNKALAIELSKNNPWDSVLLPLMKSTFMEQRMFILNEAVSVKDILTKYKAPLSSSCCNSL